MKDQIGFTVPGKPISQGSMTPIGKGKMIHKPELIAWRTKVLQVALLHARQAGWKLPLDEPVIVGAVFYLPRPKRPRFNVPATKPDLDKLQRAIGDALAPKSGGGILTEDSRIVAWESPQKKYAQSGQERAAISIMRVYGEAD